MSANIPRHLGREQDIQAFGETFKLGRWDRSVWWTLLEWCRGKIPNPLSEAEPVLLRMAAQQAALPKTPAGMEESQILERRAGQLLSMALDKRDIYVSVNSPAVQSIINSFEGSTYVLGLLLKKHHPDLTEDDVFEIMRSQSALDTIFDTALGRAPGPTPGNALAPAA